MTASIGEDGKVKNKGGRPITYTDKYLAQLADEMLAWYREDESHILKKEFCTIKQMPSEYLSRFAERSDKFKQALRMAEDLQESRLVKSGLSSKTNPVFTMFLLKNIAKYRSEPKDESALGLDSTEVDTLRGIAKEKAKQLQ